MSNNLVQVFVDIW